MSKQIEKHILNRFEPIKEIGSGAYGIVWKVVDKRKKTVYALKKNFDAFQNSTDAQRTYRQIMFLQQFQHPNIIKMQQIIKAQCERDIYILFQYMDIDLYTLIRQNILGQKHKRFIIYQVAKALYYLHTAQLVHRDIKPSNILVNENCLAKVCDFGLVRSVDDEQQSQPILTQYIATRWYRAPQILLGSRKYSKAIDVWSFGCLVGQMIRGKPFFPGNSTLNQIERVITWTGPPSLSDIKSLKTNFGRQMLELLTKIKQINRKDWLPHCPDDAMDLLCRTLQFNPQKRYSMLDILKHPYLRQFYSPQDIIVSQSKIKVFINDNQKLNYKDYRGLLHKEIKEKQSNTPSPLNSVLGKKESMEKQIHCKTVYKNRFKPVRSAPKEREESNPSKQCRTVNIKKKYDTLIGGKRTQYSRTKYIKTEEDINSSHFVHKKKNENINKFFEEKKKKSTSGIEGKRQSQVMAKYMYKNRYI